MMSKNHDQETQAKMDFFAYMVIAYILIGTVLITVVRDALANRYFYI